MQKILNYILAKSIGLYINFLSYILPEKALVLAYGYFSEPRDGKLIPEKLPEILKQATHEIIKHNNQYFQTYTWQGNQNKILLVHGWESNASRWEKLLQFLKKSGSTIIAIDAPGHGLSSGKEFDVPTYAAFINAISQIKKPNFIIGHSMGGVACAYYQHHYKQDHLEKMILLGSPSDFKVLMENYVNMLGLNSKVYHLLKNYIKQRFNVNTEEFSGEKFLKNTTISGMIVHDIHDPVVAFTEGKKLASSWQKAKFIETKNLGHSMHDDKLYENIYQFLFEA
ncbi:alpha/beta hydrolase [Flavobacterium sp.]|uniref:alpha/beta hydrolase n=1 Tax=Flavobacterium sp. TaxID=239 RepID=UPI00375224B3